MKTTVDEIILVSDSRIGAIMPWQKEDLDCFRKHRKAIHSAFAGAFLENGYWKITVKSTFFGVHKELIMEKLRMSL